MDKNDNKTEVQSIEEKIGRRQFIKIAGISTLFGAAGISALQILKPGSLDAFHTYTNKIQWAMVVDIRKFNSDEDFKILIDACHINHNVPLIPNNEDGSENKDVVKWIWRDSYEHVFVESGHRFLSNRVSNKNVLALCNHCTEPPCIRVCPTNATFKRVNDGIVMMDQHRCIGCRFCMAACPYGARSFNFRDPKPYIKMRNPSYPARSRGVVEKCTFCADIIHIEDTKPYCVEACDSKEELKGGLTFGNVNDKNSKVRQLLKEYYTVVRRPEIGTKPNVYYIIS